MNFMYTKKCISGLSHYLCNAVSFMHDNGIVHSDLKPSNVLLEARKINEHMFLVPVLADFGISHIVSAETLAVQAFETSDIIGASILFAAPEVWNRLKKRSGRVTDPLIWKAGDAYAIGVIIRRLLTRKAFWNS